MKTVCLGHFAILFWIVHDRIIKSSTYKREFNFAPFGNTKASDNVFSNAKDKSLM